MSNVMKNLKDSIGRMDTALGKLKGAVLGTLTIKKEPVYIIFDGPPGPKGGRFVEVETVDGRGIGYAEWEKQKDGTWRLGPFYIPEEPKKSS